MRPFLVIVVQERADGSSEVYFAEWHDSVQALGFDRPDESLGKRVQIRTPGWQAQGLHTAVPQQVPEGGGVEGVSVQNEIFRAGGTRLQRRSGSVRPASSSARPVYWSFQRSQRGGS